MPGVAMPIFAYRILPPRADFATSMQPAEMAVMGRHFEHLQTLHGQGLIRFVGRAENGDYGFCVFEAEDADAAHAVVRSDPAVAEGLMTVEMHPFMVVFDAPAR
jgi:uncharacterized protein